MAHPNLEVHIQVEGQKAYECHGSSRGTGAWEHNTPDSYDYSYAETEGDYMTLRRVKCPG